MNAANRNGKNVAALIIDLDGVIWRGDLLLPGVNQFIETMRNRSIPYLFATNNATATPQGFCEKSRILGLDMKPEEVITSSDATASILSEKLPSGAIVYVIGEQGIRQALQEASFHITHSADKAQAVVVGLDRDVNWEKLAEAAYAINNGALFIGTNPDHSIPTERGMAPGNGALLRALEVTTGVSPFVVGKPQPYLYLEALERLGSPAEKTLVLGDRLDTDILGGIRAGTPTALVLTGATTREDLPESKIKPDFLFNDLDDLVHQLWGAAS
ncbi:MAG: HAD-IIA family hydrolase [Anaerolineales bacterium]|nr:HAD-IIA family hydrolase [Anaerolineales bacterium]